MSHFKMILFVLGISFGLAHPARVSCPGSAGQGDGCEVPRDGRQLRAAEAGSGGTRPD